MALLFVVPIDIVPEAPACMPMAVEPVPPWMDVELVVLVEPITKVCTAAPVPIFIP